MFSDKILNKDNSILQKDNIDETLRNDLWNSIQKFYLDRVYYTSNSYNRDTYSYMRLGWCDNDDYIIDLYENFFILPSDLDSI